MSDFTRRRWVPRGLVLTGEGSAFSVVLSGNVGTLDMDRASWAPSVWWTALYQGFVDARPTAPASSTTPTFTGRNTAGGLRVLSGVWRFVSP